LHGPCILNRPESRSSHWLQTNQSLTVTVYCIARLEMFLFVGVRGHNYMHTCGTCIAKVSIYINVNISSLVVVVHSSKANYCDSLA